MIKVPLFITLIIFCTLTSLPVTIHNKNVKATCYAIKSIKECKNKKVGTKQNNHLNPMMFCNKCSFYPTESILHSELYYPEDRIPFKV